MSDIVWKTSVLPGGIVGVAYEAGLAEVGSATAVTGLTVTSGSLPPGITVSAEFLRLQGFPTKIGTYNFKLTMTDTAGGVQSPQFTIQVTAAANDLPGDILAQPLATQLYRKWPQ